jgi:hypothetical protein
MKEINIIVDVLNDALRDDPKAISRLFQTYIPCDKILRHHPTVVVMNDDSVGPLGIINGIVAALYGAVITKEWRRDAKGRIQIVKFAYLPKHKLRKKMLVKKK